MPRFEEIVKRWLNRALRERHVALPTEIEWEERLRAEMLTEEIPFLYAPDKTVVVALVCVGPVVYPRCGLAER